MKKMVCSMLLTALGGSLYAMERPTSMSRLSKKMETLAVEKPEPMEFVMAGEEEEPTPTTVLAVRKYEVEEELRRVNDLLPLYFRLKALHSMALAAKAANFYVPGLLSAEDYENRLESLFYDKYKEVIDGRFPGYLKLIQALYDLNPKEPDQWILQVPPPTEELPAF